MRVYLRENPELKPKMPKNSAAILTKSYVDSYKYHDCGEFLKAGKACLVLECGFYDYYFDEEHRQKGLKDSIEWCEIEIMDQYSPPDCGEFYVKAEDLKLIEDPEFRFQAAGLKKKD